MIKVKESALKNRADIKTGLYAAGRFTLGFLLSAARFGSMYPFGVAYAAATSRDELWRFCGVFLGCLAAGGANGVLYAAAVMICYSCRLVTRNMKIGRNRIFLPSCALLSLAVIKGALLFSDFEWSSFALLLCELLLMFAFSLLFCAAQNKNSELPAKAGRAALLIAALSAFEPARLLGIFSPARVSAAAAVICTAYCFGGAAGAGMGAAAGAMLDIAAGKGPHLTMIFWLGGLLCGVSGRVPRAVRVSLWAVGCVSSALWCKNMPETAFIIVECILTGGVFCFLPDKAVSRIERSMSESGGGGFAAASAREASEAIEMLGREVGGGEKQSAAMTAVCDRAADAVCRSCPSVSACWEKDYPVTSGAFRNMYRILRNKRGIKPEDMPFISNKCRRGEELCGELCRQFAFQQRRQSAARRKRESEELMRRQYAGMSALLRDISGASEVRGRLCASAQEKVRRVARTYFPNGRCEAYCEKDRLTVDIRLPEGADVSDGYAAAASLSLAVGCEFKPPQRIKTASGQVLRFCRGQKYKADFAQLAKSKNGEKVCGDSAAAFITEDGRAVMVLADGMGTGSGAHELSAAAASMLERLMRAGASANTALLAAMPVLESRFERSGFVTLDIMETDLYCGETVFIKCGAAPSFIVRGGRAERVWGQSMPAGLAFEPAKFRCTLKAGDTVVMATDGVEEISDLSGEPAEICQRLTSAEALDDMTAAAMKIKEM